MNAVNGTGYSLCNDDLNENNTLFCFPKYLLTLKAKLNLVDRISYLVNSDLVLL